MLALTIAKRPLAGSSWMVQLTFANFKQTLPLHTSTREISFIGRVIQATFWCNWSSLAVTTIELGIPYKPQREWRAQWLSFLGVSPGILAQFTFLAISIQLSSTRYSYTGARMLMAVNGSIVALAMLPCATPIPNNRFILTWILQ
mgnify:FL=1